jgi:glutamine synthetase type III
MADEILIIDDMDKTAKEFLLLGNKTVQIKDCVGETLTVHGLTANDLVIKDTNQTLIEYIRDAATGGVAVSTADIVTNRGTHTTVKKIASMIEEVEFEITDLQAKYNKLQGE